jgi:hypothetical protein
VKRVDDEKRYSWLWIIGNIKAIYRLDGISLSIVFGISAGRSGSLPAGKAD